MKRIREESGPTWLASYQCNHPTDQWKKISGLLMNLCFYNTISELCFIDFIMFKVSQGTFMTHCGLKVVQDSAEALYCKLNELTSDSAQQYVL